MKKTIELEDKIFALECELKAAKKAAKKGKKEAKHWKRIAKALIHAPRF